MTVRSHRFGLGHFSIQRRRSKVAILGILSLMVSILIIPVSGDTADIKSGWQSRWEKTVAAAKKEGQIRIYGSSAPKLIIQAGVFQKAYPEIKVVTVMPGRGAMAAQRLMAERRASKFLGDLVIGGTSTPMVLYSRGVLQPIKPALILPEVVDKSKWWGGKHRYPDPKGEYIFIYIGHPQVGNISYNTKLVDPSEIKSFWDFLNPKWKGKIVLRDFRIPGVGQQNMRFFYYNPEIGPKFIRRLVTEMDITLFRDTRQSVDWLGRGKFSLCFFCYPSALSRAKAAGLPVSSLGLLKEGAALSSHSGAMGFVDKAPHPNAAKVFINWLLSREGQITYQRAYAKSGRGASNSLRIDIPKDMVPPQHRLRKDIDYIEVETPDRIYMRPIIKVFEKALAEVRKRKK